jgi:carbamoyltransferase
MKIAGVWPGHDCSFCVLDDGHPIIHAELERYNREKSPPGDAIEFMFERSPAESQELVHVASVHPTKKTKQYAESYKKAEEIVTKNGGKIHFFSHHRAHAANAFYSSNLKESLVITIDGGGSEDDSGTETACTIWYGDDCSLKNLKTFKPYELNIGGVWTRITRYVFKLQNGWPLGGEEGTIMAMAAFGDASKYVEDFYKMLTMDILPSSVKPLNQPPGATSDKDPAHPYLEPWAAIARKSEQDKFDLAAGLQAATEILLKQLLEFALKISPATKNVCISGGVSLNSVAMGKIKSWFPGKIENVYIPPVPYDGGLAIGAAQIVWHEVLGNPRIVWQKNFTPYLGEVWDKGHFHETVAKYDVEVSECDSARLADLLADAKIVSVFNGKSESGRRALGNRSILADPRNPQMKDIINEKVKHRKWFRPFAPSILESDVSEWFVEYQESPYMQFVLKFKEDKKSLVPAVVHEDGTARLQTVRKEDNEWYFDFLTKWKERSGVPLILNTSFNDREPICENVAHSINCFLGTKIDYLFFPEYGLILERKKKDNS